MDKVESLVLARECWQDASKSLFERVMEISDLYYEANLDLASTAAYIGATPTELDSLLSLSELDEELLRRVSDVRPPVTTWLMLANASDEELEAALKELAEGRERRGADRPEGGSTADERTFSAMLSASGPTTEQILSTLDPAVIRAMAKRADQFKALPDKELKAMKSFGGQRGRGKVLSEKQVKWFRDMLERMADAGAIARGGIDADQAMCDQVLDALGR